MDETTNDLLRQLVAFQEESIANQKTIIEINQRAMRRNKIYSAIVLLWMAFFIGYYFVLPYFVR